MGDNKGYLWSICGILVSPKFKMQFVLCKKGATVSWITWEARSGRATETALTGWFWSMGTAEGVGKLEVARSTGVNLCNWLESWAIWSLTTAKRSFCRLDITLMLFWRWFSRSSWECKRYTWAWSAAQSESESVESMFAQIVLSDLIVNLNFKSGPNSLSSGQDLNLTGKGTNIDRQLEKSG